MTTEQFDTLVEYGGGGVFTLAAILGAVLFFGMMANRRYVILAGAVLSVGGSRVIADGTKIDDDIWHWFDDRASTTGVDALNVNIVGGGTVSIAPGQTIALDYLPPITIAPGQVVGLAPGTTVGLAPGAQVNVAGGCLRICGIAQEAYDPALRVKYDDPSLVAETFSGTLSPLSMAAHGLNNLQSSISSVHYFGLGKINDQSLSLPSVTTANTLPMGTLQIAGVSAPLTLDASSVTWSNGAGIVRGLLLFGETVVFAFAMQAALRKGLAN